MKTKLSILVAALIFSLLCGVGFVPSTITGSFNSLYPYTASAVCGDQRMSLEQDSSQPLPGVVYTENTVYCVDDAAGTSRDVTIETYAEFDKLRVKIGWGVSLVLFTLSLIVFSLAAHRIGLALDKLITDPIPPKK
ncbi:MAG: hypothetical protein JNM55_07650 [Anaerolineales bacterium]|nr:hypothetical protein [Anaerolineales bacterium]